MIDSPLRGRRVLVTRGMEKGDTLEELLEAAGATVLRVPLIATELLPDASHLPGEMARLRLAGGDAWLVLSSAVGARVAADAAGLGGLAGLRVAAVGPVTAEEARARGATDMLVGAGGTAAALAEELADLIAPGAEVLVVAASGGRDAVVPVLREAGATVHVLVAYRSVLPPDGPRRLEVALAAGPPDAVVFTSGSTVRHFEAARNGSPPPPCPAVCIGPQTAEEARRRGWQTVVTATPHTAAGVAAAVLAALPAPRQPLP